MGIIINKVNVKGYTKLRTMTNKTKIKHDTIYGKRWAGDICTGL